MPSFSFQLNLQEFDVRIVPRGFHAGAGPRGGARAEADASGDEEI
jgi:hypothetical protein